MSNRLGSLVVSLGLDAGQFTQGMTKAEYQAFKATEDMKKAFGSLAGYVAGLGLGAALVQSIRSTADYAKEIDNLSKIAGVGAVDLQGYAFAAQTVGIQTDKLADIFKDVQDKVGDFLQTGGGPLADFFENIAPKVGVTAEQFRKLGGKDALQLYVDSLQKAGVSQNEMVFYLEAIASDATALLPLLQDNGREFANLATQADKLGIVMDESAIRATKEFDANLQQMTAQLQGFSRAVAGEVIPTLNLLATESQNVGSVFGGFAEFIGSTLRTIIEASVIFASDVKFVFQGVGREIGGIAAQIAALARLDFDGFTAISDAMKADAERARTELDRFQRRVLNPALGAASVGDQSSAEARRLGLQVAPVVPVTPTVPPTKTPAKTGKATDPEAEAKRYLESLKQQLQATRDLSVEEKLLADIQAGRLGKVSAEQLKSLQDTARQIDDAKAFIEIEKEFERARMDTARATARAREEQEQLLQSMLDATPTAQLERQRSEMQLLANAFEDGRITAEQFSEAASTRLGNVAEKQKEANDNAKAFGDIMGSAFEDAIIEGKKFSDVLKGLAQDILKVFLRRQVTEPLAQAASGALGGLFSAGGGSFSDALSNLFSFEGGGWTGDGSRSGGLDGKGGYLAMVHPKERIIDTTKGGAGGGTTIVQTVSIDARGADASVEQKIIAAMRQTKQETLAAVQLQANRGGSFASAVGRA